MTNFDRRTALEVLKDLSKDLYPSYDLFGKKTLVINRDKFEAIRKKYLDNKLTQVVWVYDFMWGILPCEIDRPYHCRAGKEGSCTFEMSFSDEDIGTYVFYTKEEAEAFWEKGDE